MGLSVVRRRGQLSRKIHNNFVLYCSGKQTPNRHGVGFIVEPQLATNILDIEYVSDRIIKLRMAERARHTTLIQIYAPCNDTYTEEERTEFYNTLTANINKVKDNDRL
jgi:hypothetical protein